MRIAAIRGALTIACMPLPLGVFPLLSFMLTFVVFASAAKMIIYKGMDVLHAKERRRRWSYWDAW